MSQRKRGGGVPTPDTPLDSPMHATGPVDTQNDVPNDIVETMTPELLLLYQNVIKRKTYHATQTQY